MASADSTTRFSDRVDNYVKYRPGYPEEIIAFIKEKTRLGNGATIADIGAGTGIFTTLLLNAGFTVYAVEPNTQMRNYARKHFHGVQKLHFTDGTAEHTALADQSVEIIVCAQAFHWFNNDATKAEFKRKLKPDGCVALIWNNRVTNADPFAVAYDNLLKTQSNDYKEVNHQNLTDADFHKFFKDGVYTYKVLPNQQVFDFDGLKGRSLSSSYVPGEDTEEGTHFLEKLEKLFDRYQQNDTVKFVYKTEVYLGKL